MYATSQDLYTLLSLGGLPDLVTGAESFTTAINSLRRARLDQTGKLRGIMTYH